MRDIMASAQPAPIRIKLIVQLGNTYLQPAEARRLKEQLAPGAVNIVQKFVQVTISVMSCYLYLLSSGIETLAMRALAVSDPGVGSSGNHDSSQVSSIWCTQLVASPTSLMQ